MYALVKFTGHDEIDIPCVGPWQGWQLDPRTAQDALLADIDRILSNQSPSEVHSDAQAVSGESSQERQVKR